ncbi:hypothetical protein C0992_000971 [Termitomyces sp. T32_za158]|nr:hypothetical protein C0992_000971 [Termitomyces sp. T32_za158]
MKDLFRKPGSPSPQITLAEQSATVNTNVPTVSIQEPPIMPTINSAPAMVTPMEGATSPPNIHEGANIVSTMDNQAEIGNFPGSKAKDGLKTAWHGLKMILGQAEKLLNGTPFKMPVTAVNMLIQLGDAIRDNHESLEEVMTGIQKKVEIIGKALVSNDTADTDSTEMKEDFVRTLVEDLFKLHKLKNNGLWRDILENEQIKAEIQRILKNIDENSANFHFKETKLQHSIIPTIAYQLAQNCKSFAHSLHKSNKFDSIDASSKQMKDLLAIPWQEYMARFTTHLPSNLIVIDALDEIEERKGAAFLKELLTTINAGYLSGLKFFITCRPDPEIVDLCKQFTSDAVCKLHHVPQENVQEDIHKYLNASLLKLQNDPELVNLAKKADGLFIYASTAVKYISHSKGSSSSSMEQQKKLKKLLESNFTMEKQLSHVDEIYRQILSEAFIEFDKDDRNTRLKILHTFLCAEERISSTLAAALVNSDDIDQANSVVENLYAVLFVKDHCIFCLQQVAQNINGFKYKSKALNIVKDLQDAASFAAYFSANKAALSTPHLYISALATWAGNNLLTEWKSQFRFLPLIEGSKMETPLLLLKADSSITSVAFSPNGTQIVSGSYDNYIQVWDARTGEQVQELQSHTGPVTSVAFSLDGTKFVSGSDDRSVKVWDAETGKKVLKLRGHTDSVTSVAFSRNGAQIVSGSNDSSVRVWDALTGKQVQELQGHTKWVTSVAFSPTGAQIVSGSNDDSIRVWDALTGKQVQELQGHTGSVTSVAFSSDGTQIVSGSYDSSIQVWNAMTGEPVQKLQTRTGRVESVAFSPDGTQIVSGSDDNFVRVWNAKTGIQVQELQGHTDSVESVAFSPDGTQIVSGSLDSSVQVWNAMTDKQVQDLQGHTDPVASGAFPPDKTQIMSGPHDNSVQVWDVMIDKQAQELQGHTGRVKSVAFSPDGIQIVSGSDDESIQVWNAITGKQVQKLQGHTHRVVSVAFSPDGTQIVSGSNDNSVRVWDAMTGKQVQELQGHTDSVKSVAFSPDGTQIVSGSYEGSVQIWDVITGKQVQELQDHTDLVESIAFLPDETQIVFGSDDSSVESCDDQVQELQDPVTSVVFSPDGTQIVSGSYDSFVLWDVKTGEQVHKLQGLVGEVASVAFSPDGTQIVSGSCGSFRLSEWSFMTDEQVQELQVQKLQGYTSQYAFFADGSELYYSGVRVWNAKTGEQVQKLQSHTGNVHSVAFSPDGTQIVTGSDDNLVQVWDVKTGKQVLELQGHTDKVASVAFSPDGTQIVSGSRDSSVRVWNIMAGKQVQELQDHIDSFDGILHDTESKDHSSQQQSKIINLPWYSTSDGWISSSNYNHLMWVPHNILKVLRHPPNTHIISQYGSLSLDLSQSKLGTRWIECYTPQNSLKVKPKTLSDRAKGKHQSCQQGFEKQQLLSVEQEEVLLAWAEKASLSGKPLAESRMSASGEVSMQRASHPSTQSRYWPTCSGADRSVVVVPKPHPVPAPETYQEKATRKFKENPWVPLGALATVGALVVATVKMRRGQSQSFNQWLRVRVAAQGLTIVAICVGTWSMRPKDPLTGSLPSADADAERRRAEKIAKEKDEFEERLRGAEKAHQAEVEMRNQANRGPGSAGEVRGGWSSWLPWQK